MRLLSKIVYFLSLCLLGSSTSAFMSSGSLVLKIENINSSDGFIWIGIYDSEQNYLIKEKGIIEGYRVNQLGEMTLNIDSLNFGNYAIALFHDENGNGKLDRNVIGIPSEPYAFSKKEKSKWRVPKFKEIEIDFQNNGQIVTTKLKKWWD